MKKATKVIQESLKVTSTVSEGKVSLTSIRKMLDVALMFSRAKSNIDFWEEDKYGNAVYGPDGVLGWFQIKEMARYFHGTPEEIRLALKAFNKIKDLTFSDAVLKELIKED